MGNLPDEQKANTQSTSQTGKILAFPGNPSQPRAYQPRKVVSWEQEKPTSISISHRPTPLGYRAKLSCGHTVWMALTPPDYLYCGACLHALVRSVLDKSHVGRRIKLADRQGKGE